MVNPGPNDFDEKVNRGEDLRWVGSRCPLTRALDGTITMDELQDNLWEILAEFFSELVE